jgi:hypothetical protein
MANYTPSNLVKAQARLINQFQNNELRFRMPSTWIEFLRQSAIMIPNYEELRTREDRTVETYYRKRTSRALGTGRSFNHTGVKGDTAIFTPAWTTYNDTFSISLKQADNNVYDEQEMFNNEIENVVINFVEGMETIAVAFIFNNRSGVNNDTSGEGTFNAVQDTYEITEANNGDRAVQITKSVMKENKYGGGYVVFADTISFNKFEKDANQGTGNSTNLGFQFSGIRFVHSVELGALAAALAAPYTNGFWIAVVEGSLTALPWIPKQNRMGKVTRLQTYGSIQNPIDGVTYAIHNYETAENGTGTNGFTQDELTQFEISCDFALEHSPVDVVNETVLQAFSFV